MKTGCAAARDSTSHPSTSAPCCHSGTPGGLLLGCSGPGLRLSNALRRCCLLLRSRSQPCLRLLLRLSGTCKLLLRLLLQRLGLLQRRVAVLLRLAVRRSLLGGLLGGRQRRGGSAQLLLQGHRRSRLCLGFSLGLRQRVLQVSRLLLRLCHPLLGCISIRLQAVNQRQPALRRGQLAPQRAGLRLGRFHAALGCAGGLFGYLDLHVRAPLCRAAGRHAGRQWHRPPSELHWPALPLLRPQPPPRQAHPQRRRLQRLLHHGHLIRQLRRLLLHLLPLRCLCRVPRQLGTAGLCQPALCVGRALLGRLQLLPQRLRGRGGDICFPQLLPQRLCLCRVLPPHTIQLSLQLLHLGGQVSCLLPLLLQFGSQLFRCLGCLHQALLLPRLGLLHRMLLLLQLLHICRLLLLHRRQLLLQRLHLHHQLCRLPLHRRQLRRLLGAALCLALLRVGGRLQLLPLTLCLLQLRLYCRQLLIPQPQCLLRSQQVCCLGRGCSLRGRCSTGLQLCIGSLLL